MNRFLPYATTFAVVLFASYLTRNVILSDSNIPIGWGFLFFGVIAGLGTLLFWKLVAMTKG